MAKLEWSQKLFNFALVKVYLFCELLIERVNTNIKVELNNPMKNILFQEIKSNFKSVFVRPEWQTPQLDGFRAISIMLVIVFHCFYALFSLFKNREEQLIDFIDEIPFVFNWIWQGDKGVDIFFLLSGFLISSKLFDEYDQWNTIRKGRFYFQRFLRIMPTYFILLVVTLIISKKDPIYILAHLLFIDNFLPLDKMILQYTWTITVEMQFYLIMPFFILYAFNRIKHKITFLIGLFLVSSLIRMLVFLSEPVLYQTRLCDLALYKGPIVARFAEAIYGNLYTRFGPFILGILAAYLRKYHHKKITDLIKKNPMGFNLALLVSISIIILSASVPYHNINSQYNIDFNENLNLIYLSINRNVFSGGVAFLLLASLFPIGLSKPCARFFSSALLYPVARVSYSMYLFQFPFIFLATAIVQKDVKLLGLIESITLGKMWLISCLSIGLTFLFSVITYSIIEAPFINLYKKKKKVVLNR